MRSPFLWNRSNGAFATALWAGLFFLISGAAAAAAAAAPVDYVSCDGFPAATNVGDGLDTGQGVSSGKAMLKYLAPNFLANTTPYLRHRRTISDHIATEKNLADCDAALSDLQRFPVYWLRRVSLERARAVHNIGLGRLADADKDLALAAAAALEPGDPYYARSLGLSLDLLRAYTLRLEGDQKGAEALAMRAWGNRPYSSQIARAAITAIGPDADEDVRLKLLLGSGKYNVALSTVAFWGAFERGRFEDVVAIYPGLATPIAFPDWNVDERARTEKLDQSRIKKAVFDVQTGGAMAYALAALGRDKDARQMMSTVEQQLAAAQVHAKPRSARPSKREEMEWSVTELGNQQIAQQAPPLLRAWSALVEARLAVSAGQRNEAMSILNASRDPFPTTYAVVDVLKSVGDNSPQAQAAIERVRASLDGARAVTPWQEAQTFFQVLPDAENINRLPSFENTGGVRAATDGFTLLERPNGDWMVSYEWRSGSESMVEDLVLLWAAQAALKHGKQGFIVRQRGMIEWTDIASTYGLVDSIQSGGYYCRLEVSFVDDKQSGNPSGKNDWRFIDAKILIDQIGPLYPRTVLR